MGHRLAFTLLVTAVLFLGCSSTPGPVGAPTDAGSSDAGGSSATGIGPEGGTISANGVTLIIPAGALATRTAIAVETGAPQPEGYQFASPVFRFAPDGTTFAKPVAVTLPLSAGASNVHLFWSNAAGGFDELAATMGGDTVSGEITHFSLGFAGSASPVDAGGTTPPALPGDIVLTDSVGSSPTVLQVDDSRVYFLSVNGADNRLKWAPNTPGATSTTLITLPKPIYGLTVAGGALFWMDMHGVSTMSVGATAATELVANAHQNTGGLRVVDGDVYWGGYTLVAGAERAAVMRVPVTGGTWSALLLQDPAHAQAGPGDLIVTSGEIIWSGAGFLSIFWGPRAGGVASSRMISKAPGWMASDGTTVYYSANGQVYSPSANAYVNQGSVDTYTPSTHAFGVLMAPKDGIELGKILLDGDHLYAVVDRSRIVKISLAGGAMTTVVVGQNIWDLAQNATHLFWSEGADNTIRRLAK